MDGAYAVVAVAGHGHLTCGAHQSREAIGCTGAIAITIGVGIARDHLTREAIVDRFVAVVVDEIAHLGSTGMDQIVRVVAVVVETNLTIGTDRGSRSRTIDRVCHTSAVTITVRVDVAEHHIAGESVVGHERAVVVDRIADLDGTGEDRRRSVVAVTEDRRSTRGALRRIRHDHTDTATEAVHVTIRVAGRRHANEHVVDRTVTVVVEAVADLGGTGMDLVVRVVALTAELYLASKTRRTDTNHAHTRTEPVTIGVREAADRLAGVATVDHSVAVVVDEVADLGGTRVHSGIVGSAVVGDRGLTSVTAGTKAGHGQAVTEAIVVDILVAVDRLAAQTFVDLTVAVVVDARGQVTDLGGTRKGARDRVIAVARDRRHASTASGTVIGEDTDTRSEPVTIRIDVARLLRADERAAWGAVGRTVAVVVETVAGLGLRGQRGRVAEQRGRRLVASESARLGTFTDSVGTGLTHHADVRDDTPKGDVGLHADRVDTRRQLILPAKGATGATDRAEATIGGVHAAIGIRRDGSHAGALGPSVVGRVAVLRRLRAVARRASVGALVEVARLIAGRITGAGEGAAVRVRGVERTGATSLNEDEPQGCHHGDLEKVEISHFLSLRIDYPARTGVCT